MSKRLSGIVVALCLLLPACTSGGGSPDNQAPRFTAPITTESFVHDLALAGIGVYHLGSDQRMEPVAHPTPVRLTDEQAANAAAGAAAHAGLTGADLDSIITPPRLPAGAQPVPTSLLLLAWAKTAGTPAATLANRVIGDRELATHASVVFPTIVLSLFTADYLATAHPANGPPTTQSRWVARPGASAAPVAMARATGVCSAFQSFVDDTIGAVFNAIGKLPTWDANTGASWLKVLKTIGNGVIDAANFGISALEAGVKAGVRTALAPVISVVASVASVIAVVAAILLVVQPWAAELIPDPVVAHRSGNTHAGTFDLTVRTQGVTPDEWPTQVADCAQWAGVKLPSLKPKDAKVTWTLDYQSPEPMIRRTGDSGDLFADGTAELRYETLAEPPDVADGDEQVDGSVRVVAKVERKDLEELREKLIGGLWNAIPLPKLLTGIAAAVLHDVIAARIDAALAPLKKLRDTAADTVLAVTYHTAGPKKSPTPSPQAPTLRALPSNFCSFITAGQAAIAGGHGVEEVRSGTPVLGNGITLPGTLCSYVASVAKGQAYVATEVVDLGAGYVKRWPRLKAYWGGGAGKTIPGLGTESFQVGGAGAGWLVMQLDNLVFLVNVISPGYVVQTRRLADLILKRM